MVFHQKRYVAACTAAVSSMMLARYLAQLEQAMLSDVPGQQHLIDYAEKEIAKLNAAWLTMTGKDEANGS